MSQIIKTGTLFIPERPNIKILGTGPDGEVKASSPTDFEAPEIVSAEFVGDDMVFTKTDSNTFSIPNAKVELEGTPGTDGLAIVSIIKTGTVGLVDTYTITFSDDSTTTFEIENGKAGEDGKDGLGTIDGPAVSTDNYIPQWDGINGQLLKDGVPMPVGGLAGLTALNLKASKNNPQFTGMIELIDEWDGRRFKVDEWGNTSIRNYGDSDGASLMVNTDYIENVGLKIKGADGQNVDLIQVQNHLKEILLKVDKLGNITGANLSGTNTGDNATNSQYSGLASSKADKPNVQTVATATAITPTGNYKENEHYVTALTEALTINAPSSPSNGNTLLIRINAASAQTLTFNAIYDFIAEKPTQTPAGETLYIGAIYNSTKSKWEVTSVNNK